MRRAGEADLHALAREGIARQRHVERRVEQAAQRFLEDDGHGSVCDERLTGRNGSPCTMVKGWVKGWHVPCCGAGAVPYRRLSDRCAGAIGHSKPKEHRMSTFQTGQWVRRGRNIVILLDSPGPAVEEETGTNDTAWVQRSLNTVMRAGLAVDGIMGPNTRAAITAFQRSEGLAADGIAGPITQAALQRRLTGPYRPAPAPAPTPSPPSSTVGTFDGKAVASWLIPYLTWARQNGWKGRLNSGWRSPEHSERLCMEEMRQADVPRHLRRPQFQTLGLGEAERRDRRQRIHPFRPAHGPLSPQAPHLQRPAQRSRPLLGRRSLIPRRRARRDAKMASPGRPDSAAGANRRSGARAFPGYGAVPPAARPSPSGSAHQLLRAHAISDDRALPPAATFCLGSPKLSSPPEWVPMT